MKNNPLYLLGSLFLAAFGLASCSRSYGPAYLGSNNAYLAKPAYKGHRTNTFCLGGRVNKGVVYYEGEKNNTYELSGHIALMRRHFYYSGGLFGYWGQYRMDADPGDAVELAPYQVRGFGFRHEIGGRIPMDDKFDLLLGFGMQSFNESGEFSDLTADEADEIATRIALFPFLGPDALDKKIKNGGAGVDFNLDVRYAPPAKNYLVGLRYSPSLAQGKGLTNRMNVHQLTLHGALGRFTAYGQVGFGQYRKNAYQVEGSLFHVGLAYSILFGRRKMREN